MTTMTLTIFGGDISDTMSLSIDQLRAYYADEREAARIAFARANQVKGDYTWAQVCYAVDEAIEAEYQALNGDDLLLHCERVIERCKAAHIARVKLSAKYLGQILEAAREEEARQFEQMWGVKPAPK
jgi:hypothetical protein